jgi:Bacterial Ig-like domain
MKMLSKHPTLSALLVAATLILSACGGGDAESPPTRAPSPPPADTTPPTVSITSTEPNAKNAVTFTFSFNEDVGTSFTAEDITVTGGTKGTPEMSGGRLAELVVTPNAGETSGTFTVSVAAGAFSDAAGNLNTVGATASRAFGDAPVDTGTVVASFDENPPPTITEFGGAGYAIEVGPAGGNGNSLRITRDGGEIFAGAFVATAPIPFAVGRKTMTARVYSPTAGVRMVAKAEFAENEGTGETDPTTAVVVGWQTLTWVFNNVDLTKSYTRFTILPNLGTVGSGQAYFIDDITLAPAGEVVVPPPGVDTVLANFDETPPPPVFEFGGAGYAIEAGPTGGTGKSLKITRPGGEVFAGAYVATAAMPFAANRKTITARVYSPAAGTPIVAKAEYADNSGTGNVSPTTAVVQGWQTLTWVFDNVDLTKSYTRFTILPNLGTVGTGQSYFFDDITLLKAEGGTAGAMSFIVQPFVENKQSAYDTTSALRPAPTKVGGYETGYYSAPGSTWWWGDSFKSKIQSGYGISKADASQSFFGIYIKNGAEGWDISKATKYDFRIGTNGECAGKCAATVRLVSAASATCFADIRVPLSAAAVTPYSRKLTDFTVSGCTTNTMAAFKQSKVAELHFQMLRADMQFVTTVDQAGLYPNGLDMGDSIGFDAPTGAPPPEEDPAVGGPAFTQLTFDDTAVTYLATSFSGTVADIVNGPAGGDGKALKVTKGNDAAPWAGVTISTGPNFSIDKIPFTAAAKTMTLRVWAPAAGMKMRLKVEDASDATHNCETDAATTVANGWQTLTFNFAVRAFNNNDPNQITSDRCANNNLLLVSTINKATVFPNYGTAGAVAGDFYFDDLKFVP